MVSIHARHCSQCGAVLEVREQGTESPLDCPGCGTALLVTPVGDLEITQCSKCGGVWLPHERFQALAARHAETGKAAAAAGAKPVSVPLRAEAARYRPCPQCRQLMNRFNYGHASGVIVDACKAHGLWFDKDELRGVMAFIDSGGLVRAERVDAERERETAKALALAEAEGRRAMAEAQAAEGWSGRWSGKRSGGDLVDGLFRLWEAFRSL